MVEGDSVDLEVSDVEGFGSQISNALCFFLYILAAFCDGRLFLKPKFSTKIS